MLILPIYDDNPTSRTAVVTIILIGLCVGVSIWQFTLSPQDEMRVALSYGLVPAVLFDHAMLAPDLQKIPAWLTPVTSMFLHGGFMHLAGNMLFLWIFGNNVEDSMGRLRFAVFYILCGVAAALAQSLASPGSEVPMMGASGAIGGVLGAYLVLHPRANVGVFVWIIIFLKVFRVPAVLVLGMWLVVQIYSGMTTPLNDTEGGVAFWAHVGGFLAGAALIPFFKRTSVPLFGEAHSRPFTVVPIERNLPGRPGRVPDAGHRNRPFT